ncbi:MULTISPECIES: AMP-binding protein [unclassified Pseudonocardia]|uniref:AMP-binding protein n=1 Tax=unclassified Pseudonocardia TaxID=2619320 RepID=UPI0001FFDDF4|nr:AMP-binding protein [Pseudonocardia sp. Ae707_Ps1]OLM16776.1 Long-chain-fatty-acid--CoA ligase [Pseudonocardia sp. Ae707_Ps1]
MVQSPAERRAAIESRHPSWRPTTLGGSLRRCADAWPDRPFVIADDRSLTYSEVDRRVTHLADGLAALGVQPGDRVGLLMANHPEFVLLKFAIARAGAVAIPFNFLYRASELAFVLRQSRCSVLLSMTAHRGLDYPAILDEIAPGWTEGPTAALPDLTEVVLLPTGGAPPRGVRVVAELEALGAAHPRAGAADGDPDAPADILYTSGTTGSPKGVVVTHDAVLRTGYASALTRAFEDGRRVLFALPCYHMFAYVEGVLAAMTVGGAVVPRLAFAPEDHFAAIERHRVTEVLCVPTMTVALVEHPSRREYDLSSLIAVLSGSAPSPVWLWEKIRSELGAGELTTGYGMTECGGAMTMTLPEDPVERHTDTVGAPKLAGVAGMPEAGGALCRYAAADPLDGTDLAEGAEGELYSWGPTHMPGYWDAPEATAATVRAGRVYSGDLGRVRPDGYLQLTGRSKELFKSGGELVMPKEIEDLLTGHPGVSQAYVVGVPDERWGEIGCAWVVPEPGARLDADELVALCRERLSRFKVPKHVVLVAAEELPTTPTGKVQKFELSRLAEERLG